MNISGLVTSEQLLKVRSIVNIGTDWVRLYEKANGIIGNISKLPGHKVETQTNTLFSLSGYDWLGSPAWGPTNTLTLTSNVDLITDTPVYESLYLQMANGSWVNNNIEEAVVIDSRTIRIESQSSQFAIFGVRWNNPTTAFLNAVIQPTTVRFPDIIELTASQYIIYLEEAYMESSGQLTLNFFSDPGSIGFDADDLTVSDFSNIQIQGDSGEWNSPTSIISGGGQNNSGVVLSFTGSYNSGQSYHGLRITDLSTAVFRYNGIPGYFFRYPLYSTYSINF